MPNEYALLRDKAIPLDRCPVCEFTFRPFLRGLVHSYWRKLLRLRYCCLICERCKEIVGYEKP